MPIDSNENGRFERALRDKKFVITAEVTPPVSCDQRDLLAKALPLRGLADAVNVTDGAGARSHLGALAAAAILAENGIEPILQMTCRDRNRLAIQGDLMGAAALGVRNLLMLRGDDPTASDQPDAKPVFDLDTQKLIETAVMLRDCGQLPSGRKVGGKADFFIGAADMPLDPQPGWVPKGLQAKIAAGAQFAQTQFCMDMELLRRYLRRLSDAGISGNLFILIGLAPLRSVKSAHWIRNHLFGAIIPDDIIRRMEQAADPAAEGRRICAGLLQELAQMPGVSGAHIMAPNHEEAIPEVIAEFRG